MSSLLFSWKVILLDHVGDTGADAKGRFDITARTNVSEYHDAAPISAVLTLDCQGGKFLTQTPVIKRWDRIYMEATDQFGNTCYKSVVHVKKRKRLRQSGKGLQLKLICPHQSSNLMTHKIFLPDRRSSGYQAMNDSVTQLNGANLGTKDPTVIIPALDVVNKFGNFLNTATSNDYIYEGAMFQDVVDDIITKEGNVIAGGGALQFHYFRFQSLYIYKPGDGTDGNGLDTVVLQVFPQGYKNNGGALTNVPTVTIQKSPVGTPPSNYISTDNDDDTEQGTNIVAIGDKLSGSYPTDYSIYQGQLDTFNGASPWNSTIPYIVDQRVFYNGNFYHCTVNRPNGPNSPPTVDTGSWSAAETFDTFRSHYGLPIVQYSPLTKQKAQYWINAGGGYINAATMGAEVAVVDANVIIKDQYHNRTWADTFATDDTAIAPECLLPGNIPFDGLRVLCNGSGVNGFAGNDPNGISKSNNLLEYRSYPGVVPGWYVYRISQQDDEVYSYRENVSWTFNPCIGLGSFVSGAGVCNIGARGIGWVQGAYLSVNIPLVGIVGSFTANAQFDCVHPVKHDISDTVEIGNEKISPTDLDGNSAVYANFAPTQGPRNFFAGLNFTFLCPRNSNSIPYGAVSIGEKINLAIFDLLNMYQTHAGKVESFGKNVEDYLPIQGFAFFELLQDLIGGVFDPAGDYSMGIWIGDRKDNQILITYDHGHNNVAEPQSPPLGSLKVYRGIPGIATFLPAQQIEVLNIFDVRTAVRGGFQTMDSFDSAGRYYYGQQQVLSPVAWSNASRFHLSSKLHFSIDAFRMTKPLVSTNIIDASKPIRNISPIFQKYPNVVSKAQLDNIVNSLPLIMNFQPQNFSVQTQLRGDVSFGDPVYYTDTELVPDTTDSKPNTVKTVASEIIYTISKPSEGPGGGLRTVNLITRVWPN